MKQLAFRFGALYGFLAVLLGAFAAHGLRNRLGGYEIYILKTAAQYMMYHGLALIALSQIPEALFRVKKIKCATICFLTGVAIFSGSLILLALTGEKWLGMVTPIGGLLFLAGWFLFFWVSFSEKKSA